MAAAAKGATLAAMLISVPLTLGYLGPERFGLWMTVAAVIAMLGFADFGLGNGILNAASHYNGLGYCRSIHRNDQPPPYDTSTCTMRACVYCCVADAGLTSGLIACGAGGR